MEQDNSVIECDSIKQNSQRKSNNSQIEEHPLVSEQDEQSPRNHEQESLYHWLANQIQKQIEIFTQQLVPYQVVPIRQTEAKPIDIFERESQDEEYINSDLSCIDSLHQAILLLCSTFTTNNPEEFARLILSIDQLFGVARQRIQSLVLSHAVLNEMVASPCFNPQNEQENVYQNNDNDDLIDSKQHRLAESENQQELLTREIQSLQAQQTQKEQSIYDQELLRSEILSLKAQLNEQQQSAVYDQELLRSEIQSLKAQLSEQEQFAINKNEQYEAQIQSLQLMLQNKDIEFQESFEQQQQKQQTFLEEKQKEFNLNLGQQLLEFENKQQQFQITKNHLENLITDLKLQLEEKQKQMLQQIVDIELKKQQQMSLQEQDFKEKIASYDQSIEQKNTRILQLNEICAKTEQELAASESLNQKNKKLILKQKEEIQNMQESIQTIIQYKNDLEAGFERQTLMLEQKNKMIAVLYDENIIVKNTMTSNEIQIKRTQKSYQEIKKTLDQKVSLIENLQQRCVEQEKSRVQIEMMKGIVEQQAHQLQKQTATIQKLSKKVQKFQSNKRAFSKTIQGVKLTREVKRDFIFENEHSNEDVLIPIVDTRSEPQHLLQKSDENQQNLFFKQRTSVHKKQIDIQTLQRLSAPNISRKQTPMTMSTQEVINPSTLFQLNSVGMISRYGKL